MTVRLTVQRSAWEQHVAATAAAYGAGLVAGVELAGARQGHPPTRVSYPAVITGAIAKLAQRLGPLAPDAPQPAWTALKLLEGDTAAPRLASPHTLDQPAHPQPVTLADRGDGAGHRCILPPAPDRRNRCGLFRCTAAGGALCSTRMGAGSPPTKETAALASAGAQWRRMKPRSRNGPLHTGGRRYEVSTRFSAIDRLGARPVCRRSSGTWAIPAWCAARTDPVRTT
mgnify:CR=1 FL=1